MKHEKIIKREDGTKHKIYVNFYVESFRNEMDWRVEVYKCGPRKRNYGSVVDSDHWERRKLSMEEREKYDMEIYLQHVSADEIHQAKLELWQMLKP